MLYAFTENFVLPISHDEVVYGKRSLLSKMPGDEWQKFANVARLPGLHVSRIPARSCCSWARDIGEYEEWNHDAQRALGSAAVSDSCGPADASCAS